MCPRHWNPDEGRTGVRVAADGVEKFLADNPGLRVLRPGARDEKAFKRTVEGYADYEPPEGPWWTWEAP